ncbi:MAG: signal peptidase I [Chloroflexi bacterium]|nr:signal peptidase I [Chloroflexota bacterium]
MSQRQGLGCLFEILETLVLTVVIFWLIQTFVAQPFKVQQGSMQTTLEEGQYVLVDKLSPRWEPYELGDIIVFQPPPTWTNAQIPFIKRVIGVEGDRVELRDGKVFVNDDELTEDYLYAVDGEPQPTEPTPGGQTSWRIGAGQLFVMGDHRGNSSDSRTFGPIEVTSVAGRAWLRYWPFDVFTVLQHPTYPSAEPLGATP